MTLCFFRFINLQKTTQPHDVFVYNLMTIRKFLSYGERNKRANGEINGMPFTKWVLGKFKSTIAYLQLCSYFKFMLQQFHISFSDTVYPKKYAHGFCFAVLCCGYTLTDFPISIRLTSLALWQSNDCPSASKATPMNMDKYFMWIHYERLHNHNKAKHNKTVCIFLGIYCTSWLYSFSYTSPGIIFEVTLFINCLFYCFPVSM